MWSSSNYRKSARCSLPLTPPVLSSRSRPLRYLLPVAGEVIEINEELSGSPELLNSEPYSAWIFKLKPSDANGDLAELLDADGYKSAIGE